MATEYIRRNDAINAVKEAINISHLNFIKAKDAIEKLPSADVRPVVRSEWVLNDNRTWSCKRCHSWIPDEQRYYANYCLFCSADMRVGDTDEGTKD